MNGWKNLYEMDGKIKYPFYQNTRLSTDLSEINICYFRLIGRIHVKYFSEHNVLKYFNSKFEIVDKSSWRYEHVFYISCEEKEVISIMDELKSEIDNYIEKINGLKAFI